MTMFKATTLALATGIGAIATEPLPLVPQPVSVQRAEGAFPFTRDTAIRHHRDLANEAKLFAADLGKLTGTPARTYAAELRIHLPSQILLDLDPALDVPASGYRLEITPATVKITGKDAAGAFHGTRSVLQLLPPGKMESDAVQLPAATITDYPRFGWRGMHLDVGRHFYAVEDIKRFIDWLAFHKLNTFHWHLTEDQGWRLEIKKFPKLTEIGGFRDSTPPYGNRNADDGKRYGGFYTQEQARDIVAYAAARHITVVPEIELPGHAAAAIAAYPELGNDDIPNYQPRVMTRWGVHPYVFAPTERVFSFIDDVLTEVCDIFPSAYIHIGGDEAPKDQWNASPRVKELMKKENLRDGHDVQSYFIKRVEKILEAKGRKLIGWDEIREGGLSPKATVMSWRGEDGGIASAKEGHDVVMAPNSHTYFDHYQAPAKDELAKGVHFEAIGGFLPIAKVYSYDPVPKALTATEAKHILGVQAQLWSEYFHDFKKVEYHAFPRIAALAEVAWTPVDQKNYDHFRVRLDSILKHYDAAGLNRGEPYDPPTRKAKGGAKVETSFGHHADHWPEAAYDGNAATFFWSDREPRAGDHFTLVLKAPLAAATELTVTTGGPAAKNGDRLEQGTLEASPDGTTWTQIAEFAEGKARAVVPAGVSRLRIAVTGNQSNWLIVQEIPL
jgi:hexosaminidase